MNTEKRTIPWEQEFACRALIGELTCDIQDLENLRELERQNPAVHAEVVRWILQWPDPDVESEVRHLVTLIQDVRSMTVWRTFCDRFDTMPTWFITAYGGEV